MDEQEQVGGGRREHKNMAPGFQAAIKAIAEIHETQEKEGCGNYSRDLYPFRAIVDAALDTTISVEETFTRIDAAMERHRNYGNISRRSVLSAPSQEPSPSEPQAPSTTAHQTENRGSTTGLEKGGDV